jgi:hypothetical protein
MTSRLENFYNELNEDYENSDYEIICALQNGDAKKPDWLQVYTLDSSSIRLEDADDKARECFYFNCGAVNQ